VCFGEATKFCRLAVDTDKTYVATIRLGVTTTTGDNEGAIISTRNVAVDRPAVETALRRFTGEILQTPPMYSAIKRAGKPLYKYARAGLHVERSPRKVSIRAIEFNHLGQDLLRITVTCGKGTYIRVLAEDIGRELGCGASLASLTRTVVGSYTICAAVTLDDLQMMDGDARDGRLLPVDSLVAALPRIDLDALQAVRMATGCPVQAGSVLSHGMVRVYGPGPTYLGIATVEPHGAIVPRRLMATPSRPA
jgi:tRNA pseudouridine55 synthase